jgi:hypothetical protein
MQACTAGSTGFRKVRCHLAPQHGVATSRYTFRVSICGVRRCSNGSNGSTPAWEQQQQQQQQQQRAEDVTVTPPADPSAATDDPLEAMLFVAQQEMGMNVVWADPEEEEEELEDVLDDLEDVWMRNPAREHTMRGV